MNTLNTFYEERYNYLRNYRLQLCDKLLEANNTNQKERLERQIKDLTTEINRTKAEWDQYLTKSETYFNDLATAKKIRDLIANPGTKQKNIFSNTLSDGNQGGESILPKTTEKEVITEPFATNPLISKIKFSHEQNLEIPKLTFSIDNDDFVEDGLIAKELKATGSTVTFQRFKSKVYCDVSETVLNGADVDLTEYVKNGLRSAFNRKMLKQLFGASLPGEEAHMSFYQKQNSNYVIPTVTAESKYLAIKRGLADLHEEFRDNATIIMRYADYLDIIEALANKNTALYTAQPEQIFGFPVVFCDAATIPVVGDLNYLRGNVSLEETYESDKNIKTGINSIVLTNTYDLNFLLHSAFRLALS